MSKRSSSAKLIFYDLHSLGAKVQVMGDARMDYREGKTNNESNIQITQIFVEFLTQVTKFEQLVTAGGQFLCGFQQGLVLLQRYPMNEKSELVTSIIEENETKRLRSYIATGWVKSDYKVTHMCKMNTCFEGLKDHLSKAEQIMCELERLMDNNGCAVKMLLKSSSDVCCEDDEDGYLSSMEVDATEYASFMAVIYGMVKQDYVMQERIVSSLNLMTSVEELDGYCLMWSLRPFVDDDVVNQTLRIQTKEDYMTEDYYEHTKRTHGLDQRTY